jgi:hypothetical protein
MTGQRQPAGEPIDERPEADALHGAAHAHAQPRRRAFARRPPAHAVTGRAARASIQA